MGEANGLLECKLKDWQSTRQKVEEMHSSLTSLNHSLAYLKELERLRAIESTNIDIRDKLISPATGNTRIEIKIIMPIIYTLCFMLVAVVVWFTGVEPNLPHRGSGHTGMAVSP